MLSNETGAPTKELMNEERWKTDINRKEGYFVSIRQIKLQMKIQKEGVRALKPCCEALGPGPTEERQDCCR